MFSRFRQPENTLNSATSFPSRHCERLITDAPGATSSPQQRFPLAAQRRLETLQGGHKDIDLPGFDLLDGADIQVHHLGQLLLSDRTCHPFPADIGSKLGELLL